MSLRDAPFGFLNALKPPGITSTSFGGWVRRLLDGSAVGHWGTLDPSASGVLVLAVGNATRLLPLLLPSTKQYVFELRLGSATDTGDATGRVTAEGRVPADAAERLPAIAAGLIGPIQQIPPMFSAVKIGGRPLYVSARRGEQVARAPRTTRVFALRVIDVDAMQSRALERGLVSSRLLVECEAGLYVRTLCEELGRRLGVPSHMGALVRSAAGPFALRDARLPAEIAADARGCLVDPLGVLRQARVELEAADAARFAHGNDVRLASNGATTQSRDDTMQPRDATMQSRALERGDTLLVLNKGRLIGFGSLEQRGDALVVVPARVLTAASK